MRQARFRYTVFLAMLAFTVMLALPSTTLGWDREAAKTYAETYTSQFFDFRNPAWPSFSGGGDCTNFTSQCFDAGGIQMDAGWTSWNMVMYAGTTWRWGEEWTVAMQFWDYWKQPLPHGNRYLVGTWDWLDGTSRPDPPKNVPGVQRGDILSYVLDFDGSTWTDINHSAIVTGINSHTQITPSMDWQGTLTTQHSTDYRRVAWTGVDRNPEATWKWFGYCVWGLTNGVTSGVSP